MNQEYVRTYYKINNRIPAMYYEPAVSSVRAGTAILLVHPYGDYLTFYPGPELAKRGYRVLCANVSSINASFDEKIMDIKPMVEFLRADANVDTVVLAGHSGGATVLSAYQMIAENGTEVVRRDNLIYRSSMKEELPPADAIMFLDANWGNGLMFLFSIDPACSITNGKMRIDPALDLFNEDNGFSGEGANYSPEFMERFLKAQRERNQEILYSAQKRLEELKSGNGQYEDDEPLVIPASNMFPFNNKVFPQDMRFLSRTKLPRTLIHADGSRTEEIVRSVRKPMFLKSLSKSYAAATVTSVKEYLSAYAVNIKESYAITDCEVKGIDWNSGYNTVAGNAQWISSPSLVMGMTGGYEFAAAETIFEHISSRDKTLAFVEGASHMFTPASESEKFPGEFGDTMKNTFDYVAEWLQRYADK